MTPEHKEYGPVTTQHADDEPTVRLDRNLDGPTLTFDKPDNPSPPTAPGGRLRRRWPARGWWGRRWVQAVAVATVLVLAASVYVVDGALSVPGNDPAAAKFAEWGRDHGLGPVVTWLEQQQYQHDQPALGGSPGSGIPAAAGEAPVLHSAARLARPVPPAR
jgi:hypothetical protein